MAATFSVSAAQSGTVLMVDVPFGELADLLGAVDAAQASVDLALVRTLEVGESVEVAHHAYRVARVA